MIYGADVSKRWSKCKLPFRIQTTWQTVAPGSNRINKMEPIVLNQRLSIKRGKLSDRQFMKSGYASLLSKLP